MSSTGKKNLLIVLFMLAFFFGLTKGLISLYYSGITVLTARYLPRVADKLKKPLQWFSIIFFIAMVVLSFMGNIDAFLKCVKYIFLVVLIHNLLALGIGFGMGTAFRVPKKDRRTLTIETGIQNSGLGLVLLLGTSIFAGFPPHGGTLVITAWWGIWHIISGLTVSTIFNRYDARKAKA